MNQLKDKKSILLQSDSLKKTEKDWEEKTCQDMISHDKTQPYLSRTSNAFYLNILLVKFNVTKHFKVVSKEIPFLPEVK